VLLDSLKDSSKYEIEKAKAEIEEIKQKWMQEENEKACHIIVIANSENPISDIFESHNRAILDFIDGKSMVKIRTIRVKSIGSKVCINNCLNWLMFHLGQEAKASCSPEYPIDFRMEEGVSTIELLDFTSCKDINLKVLADKAPMFKDLSSLILTKCGLQKGESEILQLLFDKMPNLIYLDIRHNSLDLMVVLESVSRLSQLSYLMVDGNPKPKGFMEEVRRLDIHI